MGEQKRRFLLANHVGVLPQLRHKADQGLPQGGQHVGGIASCQLPQELERQLPDVKGAVVYQERERVKVLGLAQHRIKSVRELPQDGRADAFVPVVDADLEQQADDPFHHLRTGSARLELLPRGRGDQRACGVRGDLADARVPVPQVLHHTSLGEIQQPNARSKEAPQGSEQQLELLVSEALVRQLRSLLFQASAEAVVRGFQRCEKLVPIPKAAPHPRTPLLVLLHVGDQIHTFPFRVGQGAVWSTCARRDERLPIEHG
eukprot:scaffold24_cov245-Pinguiococcus_pyrenoidosus.AAC.12